MGGHFDVLFVNGLLSGMGDMAVSNSIGSNIFDILLGLGFPWALRTLIVEHGSSVRLALPPRVALVVTRGFQCDGCEMMTFESPPYPDRFPSIIKDWCILSSSCWHLCF